MRLSRTGSVVLVGDNYALTVYNNTLVTQRKSKGEDSVLEGLLTFRVFKESQSCALKKHLK